MINGRDYYKSGGVNRVEAGTAQQPYLNDGPKALVVRSKARMVGVLRHVVTEQPRSREPVPSAQALVGCSLQNPARAVFGTPGILWQIGG